MKIELPRLGGVFLSVVVVTDFFRVPCFKTGIAGRKRPASRNEREDAVIFRDAGYPLNHSVDILYESEANSLLIEQAKK